MGVTVKSTLVSKWTPETMRKLDVAVLSLATRVHRDAMRNAPRQTGNLISSGRLRRNGAANYSVIFGGNGIPYARIQELGGTIKPKNGAYLRWKGKDGKYHAAKRVYIKGKHYLERAGDQNSRRFVQELKRGI